MNMSSASSINYNSSGTGIIVFTKTEDTVLKVLYILISLADIVSNSILIFIIVRDKQLQNTVNFLIVNLLCSDIVAGLAIYPYLFIQITIEDSNAGRADLMCGFKNGLTMFLGATMVNFITLSVISLSRYLLINHPTKLHWRIHKKYVKWISMVTWIICIAVVIPNIVAYRYVPEAGICDRDWPRWINGTILFVVTVIIFSVTLFSLLFTFSFTVHTLWFKTSSDLARSSQIARRSRRIATTILGLLILDFLICWLPFGVYWLLSAVTNHFSNTLSGNIKKVRMLRYTILVAFINTCLDPVIYTLGNSNIKASVLRILKLRSTDISEGVN